MSSSDSSSQSSSDDDDDYGAGGIRRQITIPSSLQTLHDALRDGNVENIRSILQTPGRTNVNAVLCWKGTSLHQALTYLDDISKKVEICRLLVRYGADIQLVDLGRRRTPLHLACSMKNAPRELIELLADADTLRGKTRLAKCAVHTYPHEYDSDDDDDEELYFGGTVRESCLPNEDDWMPCRNTWRSVTGKLCPTEGEEDSEWPHFKAIRKANIEVLQVLLDCERRLQVPITDSDAHDLAKQADRGLSIFDVKHPLKDWEVKMDMFDLVLNYHRDSVMNFESTKGTLVFNLIEFACFINSVFDADEPQAIASCARWLQCAKRLVDLGAYPFPALFYLLERIYDSSDERVKTFRNEAFHLLASGISATAMSRFNSVASTSTNVFEDDGDDKNPLFDSQNDMAHLKALLKAGLDVNAMHIDIFQLSGIDSERMSKFTDDTDYEADNNPNVVNLEPFFKGYDLLSHAICFSEASKLEEEVNLLLEHGAIVNSVVDDRTNVLSAMAFGVSNTTLFNSANPNYRVMQLLLEKGVNPFTKSNVEWAEPLVILSPDVFILSAILGKSAFLFYLMTEFGCVPGELLSDMKAILGSSQLSPEWKSNSFKLGIVNSIQTILTFIVHRSAAIESLCTDIWRLFENHELGENPGNANQQNGEDPGNAYQQVGENPDNTNQQNGENPSSENRFNLLLRQFERVSLLQDMVRVSVYKHLLQNGSEEFVKLKIQKLPVPNLLKNFLMFDNVVPSLSH